ncbi:general stress protein [Gemmata sp.]|uniref:general stress protein n=1 Tax=Gemmata sp. TaxID=1914242 RepID=UPI003F72C4A6
MTPANTGVGASGSEVITAIGVFPDYAAAHRAVYELRRCGYRDDQIGVLGPNTVPPQGERSGLPNDPTHTRWEEGAGIGAAAGGLAGLGLGAAIAAGLMSPLGPVVAGGWLVALIASAGSGAAVGTVVGGLAGLGVPEEDARWYAGELEAGRVVVTVRGGDSTRAAEVLHAHAAVRPPAGTAIPGNALPVTPY